MPNNKYLLGIHNSKDHPRTWGLHYLPSIAKPKTVEIYTELFRMRKGYYSDVVGVVRGLKMADRAVHCEREMEHFGYNLYQEVSYAKHYTGLMALEIKVADATTYMGKQSVKHRKDFTIEDLRDDLKSLEFTVACFINAQGDGVILISLIDVDRYGDSHNGLIYFFQRYYGIRITTPSDKFTSFAVSDDEGLWVKKIQEVVMFDPSHYLVQKVRSEMEVFQKEEVVFIDSFNQALQRQDIIPVVRKGVHGFFVPSIEAPTADLRFKRNHRFNNKYKHKHQEK